MHLLLEDTQTTDKYLLAVNAKCDHPNPSLLLMTIGAVPPVPPTATNMLIVSAQQTDHQEFPSCVGVKCCVQVIASELANTAFPVEVRPTMTNLPRNGAQQIDVHT